MQRWPLTRDRSAPVERAPVSRADPEGVTVLFSDGSRERGDVLIGADGIHSVIREQLFGSERISLRRLSGVARDRRTGEPTAGARALGRARARLAGGVLSLRRAEIVLVSDPQ